VVITAYNKPSRLISLVGSLWSYGFYDIHIQFDGPRNDSVRYLQDSVIDVLSSIRLDYCHGPRITRLSSNIGGPAAIPNALNEYFRNNPSSPVLVLEEDLYLVSDPSTFLSFAASQLRGSVIGCCLTSSSSVCRPLIAPYFDPWGWMISPDAWSALRSVVPDKDLLAERLSNAPFSPHHKAFWLDIFDKIYVREGSPGTPRHWDYDISLRAIQSAYSFLYPSSSLVVNLGGCSRSQNTSTVPLRYRIALPESRKATPPYPLRHITSSELVGVHNARHRPPLLRHLFRESLRRIGFQRMLHSLYLLTFLQLLVRYLPLPLSRLAVFQDPFNGEALLFGSWPNVCITTSDASVEGYLTVFLPPLSCLNRPVVQYSPILLSRPMSLCSILLPDALFPGDRLAFLRALSNYRYSLRPGGSLLICLRFDVESDTYFLDLQSGRLCLAGLIAILADFGFVVDSDVRALACFVQAPLPRVSDPCISCRYS